jgi:hypothetical protein
MKRVALLGAAILLMFACSSENSVSLTDSSDVNSFKKIGEYDLKAEYLAMLESQSYIDYMAVSTEFHTNIGEGEEPDFENAAAMLSWIEDNLSQTTFNSYQEAEGQWTVVKSKVTIMIADNESFFDAYFGTKPVTLIGIIPIDVDPVTTSQCLELCTGAMMDCTESAVSKLNEQMAKLDKIPYRPFFRGRF